MLVRKSSKAGFDSIATSAHPGEGFPVPEKTPYITFRMPMRNQDKCAVEYYDDLEIKGFALLGLPRIDQGDYAYITITNERKIVQAIQYFFSLKEYHLRENRELFLQLKKFSYQCKRNESVKRIKFIPPKSKLVDNYERVPHPKFVKSKNETFLVRKKTAPKKEYIFKASVTGRPITEIEAFNGFCYQLLLGDRHPKVRSVHDANGRRRGVISKVIPGFQSVYQRASQQALISKDTIINSEMVKVWVAGYVEEEMDFHADNYGFDRHGFCAKIDDDRSTWPITSRYRLIDPELGDEGSECFKVPPVIVFKPTGNDIEKFPFLTDAQPCFWCDRNETAACFESGAIYQAQQEKKFNDDKYYLFLKRILIPDSVYAAIGNATISHPAKRAALVAHKIKKTKELEKVLLMDPGFQAYVMDNPNVIKQIGEEFAEYNDDLKKARNQALRVNTDQVKKRFFSLRRRVYLQKGIDLFAVSDVVKDAFTGAGIALLTMAIVAGIVLSAGIVIPTFGLSVGGLIAVASVVVALYSMLAACVGMATKHHAMKNKAQQPNQASPGKQSASHILSALDVKPLASGAPFVSSQVIPGAVRVDDIYQSSSDEWLYTPEPERSPSPSR
jgi:hypothetical protein